MITASELLAAAHKADEQIKELSDAAEDLRQAEVTFRELQQKLVRFKQATSEVLGNKSLYAQLTNVSSINEANYIARDTATYIGRIFQNNRLDELI
jgi:hypothetical protein